MRRRRQRGENKNENAKYDIARDNEMPRGGRRLRRKRKESAECRAKIRKGRRLAGRGGGKLYEIDETPEKKKTLARTMGGTMRRKSGDRKDPHFRMVYKNGGPNDPQFQSPFPACPFVAFSPVCLQRWYFFFLAYTSVVFAF